MDIVKRIPTVFVSSTCYDLNQVREDLKEFLEINYGFETLLSEFNSFPIDPCKGTFENCLENVDKRADVFILIIGDRYGYITDSGKSITNLEYLHAKSKGIPIFIFVKRSIYNNLSLWRDNQECNFSKVVDNPKLFDFVSEIYDSNEAWVYNFEKFQDIKITLRNQFALIFSDGLLLRERIISKTFSDIEKQVNSKTLRIIVEKPYAWEYKFFASVLNEKYNSLQEKRWDLKYGLYKGNVLCLNICDFLDVISAKFDELLKLVEILKSLLENAYQDAIDELEESDDLKMTLYVAKSIINIYERIIDWALYFKTLSVDEELLSLVNLLYKMPNQTLNDIENFISEVNNKFFSLPDIDDGKEYNIKISCTLNDPNTQEINDEIDRIRRCYIN